MSCNIQVTSEELEPVESGDLVNSLYYYVTLTHIVTKKYIFGIYSQSSS